MKDLHVVEGLGGRHSVRRDVPEELRQTARRFGWTTHTVALADVAEIADTAERLVVCGGDGLVHQVAGLLAGRATPLAIVPSGTGNDAARALGITADNAIGLATDPAATPTPIDLIQAGDRFGVSVATLGYSGRVNATANSMKFPPGSAKYSVAAIREIGRLRPVPVRLVLDGGASVIDGEFTMIAFGNTSSFGGGMQICPDADPTDGLLDIVTVGPVGRFEFVRWLPKVFRGTHLGHAAVATTRAATVEIVTDEPLWVDGEPFAPPPVTLRATPAALHLLTP